MDVTTFRSRRSVVYSRHGVVAASQPLAAAAGARVLADGGTAADAAVATAAMLAVVEPMSTGIGGDCFALYYDAAARRVTALNGSGRAAGGASLDELRALGWTSIPLTSAHAVTVPGTVAGWSDLLARHGQLPLERVLAPAIAAAEQGYPVSEWIAHGWEVTAPKLQSRPAGAELLLDGRAPRAGEIVRLPTLGATLRAIAAGGADAFYRGPLAERIAATAQAEGAHLSAADLAAHRSTWDTPIRASYRGYTVWECPPNGQGLAALLAFNLAEGFDLAGLGLLSADRLHLMIECMRTGFADARWFVADPAVVPVPIAALLDPAYAARRRADILLERARPEVAPGVPAGQDTVYLATADAQGNACSFINSLYYGFGTGIVVPGAGIALQNRGACFTLDPEHPNCLAPGKRPYHTIIPAMATRAEPGAGDAGELYACFGVMGGYMQPQGHFQVFSRLVDDGLDPQRALDLPRFYLEGGTAAARVLLEEGIPVEVAAELARRGHAVDFVSGFPRGAFGGGQVITRDANTGVLAAGSDPRKDGAAIPSAPG
jgi:gamma-glutamyltranspeptidase/glutathione hydrolase